MFYLYVYFKHFALDLVAISYVKYSPIYFRAMEGSASYSSFSHPSLKTFSNQVAIEMSTGAKRADAEALAHRHRLRLVGEVNPCVLR